MEIRSEGEEREVGGAERKCSREEYATAAASVWDYGA